MKQLTNVITDQELLGIALRKAGNFSRLAAGSGVGRTSLWRLANGKLARKSRNSTIEKLTEYILGGDDANR
ncbi:MAG: hypothetical protein U0800_12725 [Isosphaeraceae bacterium]